MIGMPASGYLIERWGAGAVVRLGAGWSTCSGWSWPASRPRPAPSSARRVGLLCYGFGTGIWDVAMNVEGAAVERELGRSIMPRFHAGWSARHVHRRRRRRGRGRRSAYRWPSHYPSSSAASPSAVARVAARGAPSPADGAPSARTRSAAGRPGWSRGRWRSALMVLGVHPRRGRRQRLAGALARSTGTTRATGSASSASPLFVAAMTLGRLGGPIVLDRFGRAPTMLASALAATVGVLIVVWTGVAGLAVRRHRAVGARRRARLPGRDERRRRRPGPRRPRVSVVSTIGYGAFLAGPPLLGFVGDHVGTLDSLLVIPSRWSRRPCWSRRCASHAPPPRHSMRGCR